MLLNKAGYTTTLVARGWAEAKIVTVVVVVVVVAVLSVVVVVTHTHTGKKND